MPKEIILFNQDSYSFKEKFYILIDLFISIYYLQILCGFFSGQIGVFNKKSTSDNIKLIN